MARNERDFSVPAGETFKPVIRWGTGIITSKPITGITKAVPAVVTAVAHALPDGWPCAVVGAQGMTQINATRYPPQGSDWKYGTVLSADSVRMNDVNSADFSTWSSGGYLVYDTPATLVGVTITMGIYANADFSGTPLATLTSGVGITLDNTLKTITPLLQTAGLAWNTGYYRVDATDGSGIVTELLRGVLTIE